MTSHCYMFVTAPFMAVWVQVSRARMVFLENSWRTVSACQPGDVGTQSPGSDIYIKKNYRPHITRGWVGIGGRERRATNQHPGQLFLATSGAPWAAARPAYGGQPPWHDQFPGRRTKLVPGPKFGPDQTTKQTLALSSSKRPRPHITLGANAAAGRTRDAIARRRDAITNVLGDDSALKTDYSKTNICT